MKRMAALILSFWLTPVVAAWPTLSVPPNTKIESLGNDVRLNGIPMRISRLLSREPADSVAAFYRKALAPDYIERPLLGDRLFSKGLGDYFLTVRIRQLGRDVTETLISVSDARAAKNAGHRPLGFALPAETRVLSDMESEDSGKISRQLVLANQHAVHANIEFFSNVLAARGYKRESGGGHKNDNSEVLLFAGAQREARLVVSRTEAGSNVVLTTLQTP